MKKAIFTLIILFAAFTSGAQILNPAKFSYTAVKKGANQYEVRDKIILDHKRNIYSVSNPEGGAEPTVLKIDASPIGKTKEVGKLKTVYDKEFGVNQKYFETTVDFVQLVKTSPGTKK